MKESESLTLCKLIILYMLDRAEVLMSSAQVSEFLLGKQYVDYLQMTQVQAELLEEGLVSTSKNQDAHNRTYLVITPEGRSTLRDFRSRIGEEFVWEVEHYFQENSLEMKEDAAIYGSYYKLAGGGYSAHLVMQERDQKLVDLSMSVPTEELAEHICSNWEKKNEKIYQFLADELIGE